MSDDYPEIADALLAASLPIDPNDLEQAAENVADYYGTKITKKKRLPADRVANRFIELWELWLSSKGLPQKELKDVVSEAVSTSPKMSELGKGYFKLIRSLETTYFMGRQRAIALVGCAPLIRTLVVDQHLSLDRVKLVINIPGTSFGAIKKVLREMEVSVPFNPDMIRTVYEKDIKDVASLFGDSMPQEADVTFKGLLGSFPRSESFGDEVCELVCINFNPYLFILYYELLTIESTDRFPGHAVYEFNPRSQKYLEPIWREMYKSSGKNPYLNNAKSVYSLDRAWAETKLSKRTQNGSLLLADIFDIMAELPYSTRRRVARITRCYLVLMANQTQTSTPLPAVTKDNVRAFVSRVGTANSKTSGVLDQRLVEFLTMCSYDSDEWYPRGLGSSVNESNAAGHKYGDVEYYDTNGRRLIRSYEAHGGALRDEYVESHINSLGGIVTYYEDEYAERGEEYKRDVEVAYVAHDVSRLSKYRDGHTETISGVKFTFRFITFQQLLEESDGMDAVMQRTDLFEGLIHQRISRLPDAYALKRTYCEIAGIEPGEGQA